MGESQTLFSVTGKRMSIEARRNKRNKKRKTGASSNPTASQSHAPTIAQDGGDQAYDRLALMLENWPRDKILNLVSNINNVFQDKLGKDAPFMSYIIIGMQSTGKSTIVERFLKIPLNIVADGTGTRCPLDITVIHDITCSTPRCELRGDELEKGEQIVLNVQEAFTQINNHTKKLSDSDRFSTKPLRLVFRANNVPNMRLVDLPGIISSQSDGKKDNREDIKKILQHEMAKPNTKLCVLLEPREFETNAIIDFCDKSFDGRQEWIREATFLMTKFDKQIDDTCTGTRANTFFELFHKNGCFPFLVSTPILDKVDLEPVELYQARLKMLATADEEEKSRFAMWFARHKQARKKHATDETLKSAIGDRVGFAAAEKHLQKEMLKDIMDRLPVVIGELNKEKVVAEKELQIILEKERLTDPKELKKVSGDLLTRLANLVLGYLEGDLEVAINFPDRPMILEDEIQVEEEDQKWARKNLGHLTLDEEDNWRDSMCDFFEESYPDIVQPDQEFLGGKQIQRALEFNREAMIRAIPSRQILRKYVANCTGYGSSEKENWERAMLQVVQVCLRQACHPGINYAVRHVGSILRGLFHLALEDAKLRGKDSASFKLLPSAAEEHFAKEFEKMMWSVVQHATSTGHSSIEPLYESIDPSLPEFAADHVETNSDESEDGEATILSGVTIVSTGEETKDNLIKEGVAKAMVKKTWMPEARSSMVTEAETDLILEKSYKYVQALMKITHINLRFHFKKHLLQKFKDEFKGFRGHTMEGAEWDKLAQPDPVFEQLKTKMEDKIQSIEDSLKEVERLRATTA